MGIDMRGPNNPYVEVRLDDKKGSNVFRSGQEITGQVVVTAKLQDEGILGVKIRFEGEARVKLQEKRDKGGRVEVHHHHSQEKYFDYVETLFPPLPSTIICQEETQDDQIKMAEINAPDKTIKFPFIFKLPENIPCSYEGQHGWVRYCVSATVNRAFGTVESSKKKFFSVISELDLNGVGKRSELHFKPAKYRVEKHFRVQSERFPKLKLKKGSLTLDVGLIKTAFASGEVIKIDLFIGNSSPYCMRELKAELKQRTRFHLEEKTEIVEATVNELATDEMYVNEPLDISLVVPAVPPTGLQNCSIIDIDYWVELSLSVCGSKDAPLTVSAPLVVGTIPLLKHFNIDAPQMDSNPNIPFTYSFKGVSLKPIPTPSYAEAKLVLNEEAVDGSSPYKDGRGGDRNNNPKFIPKYPMWSQAANLNKSRSFNSSRNG